MENSARLKPNFTQIPNVLLDDWMSDLSLGEVKVLLYVMRRTYGFQKESDNISISQICDGIEGKDKGTGLSRQTALMAISSLEEIGILSVDRSDSINRFSLSFSGSLKNRLVKKLDQPSLKIRPKVVKKLDTQYKEKESKKERYGEMSKVLLSREEHSKLVDRFGQRITDELIFELDTYVSSKGKKYASHYATILSWAKRKADRLNEKRSNSNLAF